MDRLIGVIGKKSRRRGVAYGLIGGQKSSEYRLLVTWSPLSGGVMGDYTDDGLIFDRYLLDEAAANTWLERAYKEEDRG